MTRKKIPTRTELEKMAEHVIYEVDMFRQCLQGWRALNEKHPRWNLALENALIHFRVLREFFLCLTPKYDDDVVASDYIAKGKWNPPQMPVLQSTKDAIDKRLAHFATARLHSMNWPRGEMEKAIEDLITSFKHSLGQPEAAWFSKLQAKSSGFVVGDDCSSTVSVNVIPPDFWTS